MKSAVAYVRSLFGWLYGNSDLTRSLKRDRAEDEFSSDDEIPSAKRLRNFKRTSFPGYMSTNDSWEKQEKQSKNVRYVPIEIDNSQASTSTPIEVLKPQNCVRAVPIKLVSVHDSGPSTPFRKPRMHTPVRPEIHAVIDNETEEPEMTWVQAKLDKQSTSKQPKLYINLDEEENQHEEDTIFLKKVSSPSTHKPYKLLFTESSNEVIDLTEGDVYYRVKRSTDKNTVSPKTYSKFKAPLGVTKSYKKPTPPIPKWMQTMKRSNTSNSKNRLIRPSSSPLQNGNTRSTIFEVFDLDEKQNYRELIKKVTESMNSESTKKLTDFTYLVEDAASFRLTQRTQKQALEEINVVEKGLVADKKNDSNKEYDPITVASINSSDSEIEIVSSEASTSSSVRIGPINTLRDSFKTSKVLEDNWLLKLENKYRYKKLEAQEKLKEARRESDIISKVNSDQKIAHLEHKLKYELSIPESIFEEPQPTVELPKLTSEQEKLVNRALGPGPATQVLVEKFNLRLTRRDLQTLSGLNWLNDEVINFYMNLLMQRSEEQKDLPKVYATNTFFYPKLMQSGQAGLRRWTRKIDVFAHDLMVVPVHLGVHWCLSLVDFRERKVRYLDSMGGRNQACLDALVQYLRDEHQDKKGKPFDDKGWKTECLSKDIPQQMNGSDCGMFACTFAEFSCRNAPYSFTQSHMPYLRRKAAYEILSGKLLL